MLICSLINFFIFLYLISLLLKTHSTFENFHCLSKREVHLEQHRIFFCNFPLYPICLWNINVSSLILKFTKL